MHLRAYRYEGRRPTSLGGGNRRTPTAIGGDLERHNRLDFGYARTIEGWPLLDHGVPITVAARGNIQISDGDALRQLALAGVGTFLIGADLAAGRLLPVLEDCNPGDREPLHAVFLGQGGQMPARVRAFLDYLVETVRLA